MVLSASACNIMHANSMLGGRKAQSCVRSGENDSISAQPLVRWLVKLKLVQRNDNNKNKINVLYSAIYGWVCVCVCAIVLIVHSCALFEAAVRGEWTRDKVKCCSRHQLEIDIHSGFFYISNAHKEFIVSSEWQQKKIGLTVPLQCLNYVLAPASDIDALAAVNVNTLSMCKPWQHLHFNSIRFNRFCCFIARTDCST